MKMPPYPVLCYAPGCGEPARFKIAARWSDGITRELKTYSLACLGCVGKLFADARVKQAACRPAAGETMEPASVFELSRGNRDRELVRREDLEGPANAAGAT